MSGATDRMPEVFSPEWLARVNALFLKLRLESSRPHLRNGRKVTARRRTR